MTTRPQNQPMRVLPPNTQVAIVPGVVERAVHNTARSLRVAPQTARMGLGATNIAACIAASFYFLKKKRSPRWIKISVGLALAYVVSLVMKGADKMTQTTTLVQQQGQQRQIAQNPQATTQARNNIAQNPAATQANIQALHAQQRAQGLGGQSALFATPKPVERFEQVANEIH